MSTSKNVVYCLRVFVNKLDVVTEASSSHHHPHPTVCSVSTLILYNTINVVLLD